MIKDNLKATGKLVISLNGEDIHANNLVVNTGLTWIAGRMATGDTVTNMSHMAIGVGTTAPAASQAALVSEVGRVALESTTAEDNEVTYIAIFPAGVGTGAIVEAGIFNAATAGTMLSRTVFPVVNKGTDDILVITWTVTIS